MSVSLFKSSRFFRVICMPVIICFLSCSILTPEACAQLSNLPAPGTMVMPTHGFMPVTIKGLQIHPDNPLLFDFILDSGKSKLSVSSPAFKEESQKLIKYFLTALTIKEDDLWVNLSPYEKDRIITDELGQTILGRDMLAQDYVLKQLTATMMSPDDEIGQKFWKRVHARAQKEFGTSDIPQDTFNKVWIVAERAKVVESNNSAYVVDAHLKVMTDSDYVAIQNVGATGRSPVHNSEQQNITNQILREIIIPEIEHEVNHGKNFAPLRQMFHAMILASWYKIAIKNALLNQVYSNQAKTDGVLNDDPNVKQKIYDQYLQAFKNGVSNYIKEEYDPDTQQLVARKYFSGGELLSVKNTLQISPAAEATPNDLAMMTPVGDMAMVAVRVEKSGMVNADKSRDKAMFAKTILDETLAPGQTFRYAFQAGQRITFQETNIPAFNKITVDMFDTAGSRQFWLSIHGQPVFDSIGMQPNEKLDNRLGKIYWQLNDEGQRELVFESARDYKVTVTDAAMMTTPAPAIKEGADYTLVNSDSESVAVAEDINVWLDMQLLQIKSTGEYVTRFSARRLFGIKTVLNVDIPGNHYNQGSPNEVMEKFGLRKAFSKETLVEQDHKGPRTFTSIFYPDSGKTVHYMPAFVYQDEGDPAWTFIDTKLGNTAHDSLDEINRRRQTAFADQAMISKKKAMFVSTLLISSVSIMYPFLGCEIINMMHPTGNFSFLGPNYQSAYEWADQIKDELRKEGKWAPVKHDTEFAYSIQFMTNTNQVAWLTTSNLTTLLEGLLEKQGEEALRNFVLQYLAEIRFNAEEAYGDGSYKQRDKKEDLLKEQEAIKAELNVSAEVLIDDTVEETQRYLDDAADTDIAKERAQNIADMIYAVRNVDLAMIGDLISEENIESVTVKVGEFLVTDRLGKKNHVNIFLVNNLRYAAAVSSVSADGMLYIDLGTNLEAQARGLVIKAEEIFEDEVFRAKMAGQGYTDRVQAAIRQAAADQAMATTVKLTQEAEQYLNNQESHSYGDIDNDGTALYKAIDIVRSNARFEDDKLGVFNVILIDADKRTDRKSFLFNRNKDTTFRKVKTIIHRSSYSPENSTYSFNIGNRIPGMQYSSTDLIIVQHKSDLIDSADQAMSVNRQVTELTTINSGDQYTRLFKPNRAVNFITTDKKTANQFSINMFDVDGESRLSIAWPFFVSPTQFVSEEPKTMGSLGAIYWQWKDGIVNGEKELVFEPAQRFNVTVTDQAMVTQLESDKAPESPIITQWNTRIPNPFNKLVTIKDRQEIVKLVDHLISTSENKKFIVHAVQYDLDEFTKHSETISFSSQFLENETLFIIGIDGKISMARTNSRAYQIYNNTERYPHVQAHELIPEIDQAMAGKTPVGGIDLDADKMGLEIDKQGRGIEMQFDPAMIADFQSGDFTGVQGVILNIVPIASPLPLLGLENRKDPMDRKRLSAIRS